MHVINFNTKVVQNILKKENAFISDILSKLPIPVSAITRGANDDEYVTVPNPEEPPKDTKFKKTTRARTIEELQNRFTELRGKKNIHYKDRLERKGLKNRIKKREKKQKRKINKKPKLGNPAQNGFETETSEPEIKPEVKPAKPVFNSQGKMVFSKFDFSESSSHKSKKQKTRNNDPQAILENLEKQNAKLREMKASGDTEKAEEMKQDQMWKSAIAKADGQKVKDNPMLLKKTIKRKEQQVQKSKKKWKAREDGVQKAKDDRQRKRTENINKRKKDKKNTKLKKSAKKGKIIPGF